MAAIVPFFRSAELDHLARRVVTSAVAPVCACAACFRSADNWHIAVGAATNGQLGPQLQPNQLVFDLASVTKPCFAIAVHHAAACGRLDLNATLASLLPAIAGTPAARFTLDALLSHRSGLAAHHELYRSIMSRVAPTKEELLRIVAHCVDVPATQKTKASPVYSDLGYILAGAAMETIFEQPLDEWVLGSSFFRNIDGLGSARQWLRSTSMGPGFVPTEVVPWRGGLLRGVVHDENAWLLAGHGIGGHAGLFGTVVGVASFGTHVLDALRGRLGATLRIAATRATHPRPDGTLCAGFDRCSPSGSSAGSHCSEDTFGHLGFTGTSFWCDAERETVAIFLTNRVCPSRENLRIRAARPEVHDALFRWADSQREALAKR